MRLYLLPNSFNGQAQLELSGKDAQYLVRVLRLKKGQKFTGRDSQGNFWDLEILGSDKQTCLISCTKAKDGIALETTDSLPDYQGSFPQLYLFQCLCKGKKLEQIVRQATEIGTTMIIPVQSRHCVVDVSNKKQKAIDDRTFRLDTMVKEAIQQSGSKVPTSVSEPINIHDLPTFWNNRGLGLFFHQTNVPGQQSLAQIVKDYRKEAGSESPIAILIGPEGGFSQEEVSELETSGFHAVLLKTNILRAETAAIYALATVQMLMTE